MSKFSVVRGLVFLVAGPVTALVGSQLSGLQMVMLVILGIAETVEGVHVLTRLLRRRAPGDAERSEARPGVAPR